MNTPKIHVTDGTWTSGVVGVRAHFTNASFAPGHGHQVALEYQPMRGKGT
jgi:hypothetical protein